jgi:hypothetical protein
MTVFLIIFGITFTSGISIGLTALKYWMDKNPPNNFLLISLLNKYTILIIITWCIGVLVLS